MCKSFTGVVKFIPKNFILFDAIVDGIVFLISFSDYSLLMYRNTTNFYVLILYTATLLNSFIISNRVCVCCVCVIIMVFIYKFMNSTNRDNFTSSFPI